MLYVLGNRLDFLQFLPKNSICAEVGVFTGAFSENIRHIVQPSELHLIDTWELYDDWDTMFAPHEAADRANFETWFKSLVPGYEGGNPTSFYPKMFEGLQRRYAEDPRVHLHRGYSHNIGVTLPDKYFDFIYLDASHKYDDVLRDLLIYSQKLRDGGIIMGDDFYDILEKPADVKHVGTVQAVSQFLKRAPFQCLAVSGASESNFVLANGTSGHAVEFLDRLYQSNLFLVEINDSQLANYCHKTLRSRSGFERRFVPSF